MQELLTFLSNHLPLTVAVIIVFVLAIGVEGLRARRNVFLIRPTRAVSLINRENAVVIDIRANEAYGKGHIIDAIPMTLQEIKTPSKKLEKFRTRPIIMVGEGSEPQKIAEQLLKQGYQAYSLSGGMRAWQEEQLPLVKDK